MKAFIIIFVVLLSSLFSSCSDDESISLSRTSKMEPAAMSSDYAMGAPSYAASPKIESDAEGSPEPRIQINGNYQNQLS